jgi:type IV secretory pathway ATPase VirB11/archaellum biosynthesis ATPase
MIRHRLSICFLNSFAASQMKAFFAAIFIVKMPYKYTIGALTPSLPFPHDTHVHIYMTETFGGSTVSWYKVLRSI